MPIQRKLHLTNSAGRNATVAYAPLRPPRAPRLGVPGRPVTFLRYLATTPEGLHEGMVERFGEDYAQELIDGDPEVDLEQIGRVIGDTRQVYLSAKGEVLHAAPKIVEIIFDPDGRERERREPEDVEANVNELTPVLWTGRKMKKRDALRKFVFGRTVQITHVDGLSYDYLHGIAKELADGDEMVLVGSGEKGRGPLIFQVNGTPWRGFLEGRVDGPRYMLLLHLSNMELKAPAPKEG